jgi:hypothetical protein
VLREAPEILNDAAVSEETGGTEGGQADGVYDPLASTDARTGETTPGSNPPSAESVKEGGRTDEKAEKKPEPPMVEFWTPSQLKAYVPPENQNMVGDYHLQRGNIGVLAGPPGCGKSRAAMWLAILGATGSGNWLGFDVHCRFRTLILQNENGLTRLHRDFEAVELPAEIDSFLRISAPPTLGLNMANLQFRTELKAMMRNFAPHLLVVDPWNALARDAMEKDFQEAFDRLREILAASPEQAACLIVHHLRKPKSEDRHRGRSLSNLLAGSYTIISIPRSVIVMQPASDDVEDCRIVVSTSKNNDGESGPRSAWERRNGFFVPVPEGEFDFGDFDKGGAKPREVIVKPEHLREVFDHGRLWLKKSDAVSKLEMIAGVGRSAAYEALKEGGRYTDLLTVQDDGKIGLRASGG